MAWWKTGEGDDVTGDWPADILGAAQADLLGGGPGGAPASLSLAELLRTWQDALNGDPGQLVSGAPAGPYQVSALACPDTGIGPLAAPVRMQASPSPSDPALQQRASKALHKLAQAYRDAKDRLPRVSEVRSSLQFSLAGPAEDGLLADGPLQLARLDIATGGPAAGPDGGGQP